MLIIMQQSLILLLVFVLLALASKEPICTHGYRLVKNRCLKLFPELSSYGNASRQCYQHGGWLVTIRSEEENLDVLAISGKNYILWIGLHCFNRRPSECIWDDSLGNAEQYSAFENLSLSEGTIDCVTMNTTNGFWKLETSSECIYANGMHPFVCEQPTTIEDDCQNNYNGYCYIPHSEAKSFENAQKSCEEECGNLVSIHSANENRYVEILAKTFWPDMFIYIGGIWQEFGFSRWTDGSYWEYDHFEVFKKLENVGCLEMFVGLWVPVSCNETRKYICKRPAGEKCVAGRPEKLEPLVTYTCNSTLLQTPGIIVSPLSKERQYCEYRMYTTEFYSILLTFTTLDIDPKSDELKVYDGNSTESRLIGTFKGHNSDEFSVKSSRSAMFVTFRSNGNGNGKGFEARFEKYQHPSPLKRLI